MDFAQILDKWEKGQNRKNQNEEGANRRKESSEDKSSEDKSKQAFEKWINSEEHWKYYDKGEPEGEIDAVARREYLRKIEPEDQIDLHGLTLEQSLSRLDRFLSEALSRGLRKVLIVHGKGHHSKGPAVLPKAVLEYLQQSPIAGELGIPRREKGGSGATWVIIKNKTK